MPALCLLAAGKLTTIAATAFTLSWTHSVERTRWEESWRITPDKALELVEARIKGSGAGMEPPPDAVLKDGWYVYTPKLPARRELLLATSAATGAGWTLCADGQCTSVGALAGDPVTVRACGQDGQ